MYERKPKETKKANDDMYNMNKFIEINSDPDRFCWWRKKLSLFFINADAIVYILLFFCI